MRNIDGLQESGELPLRLVKGLVTKHDPSSLQAARKQAPLDGDQLSAHLDFERCILGAEPIRQLLQCGLDAAQIGLVNRPNIYVRVEDG